MTNKILVPVSKYPECCEFELKGDSIWITVGTLSVLITKRDEGVSADIYVLDKEDEGAIAGAYALFSEGETDEEV